MAYLKESLLMQLILVHQEFLVAEDRNRISHSKDYQAHTGRVTGVLLSERCQWLLSVGRDKMFKLHCAQSGLCLGSFVSEAWCTAVAYPFKQNAMLVTFLV